MSKDPPHHTQTHPPRLPMSSSVTPPQKTESGILQTNKWQHVASFRENYVEPTFENLWLLTYCVALANSQNLSESSLSLGTPSYLTDQVVVWNSVTVCQYLYPLHCHHHLYHSSTVQGANNVCAVLTRTLLGFQRESGSLCSLTLAEDSTNWKWKLPAGESPTWP